MRSNNPALLLFIVVGALLAAGLACSGTQTESPANTAATTPNSSSPAASPATTSATKNITGTYDVTGTNSDGGGAYKAALVVTPRDDVYQFSWTSAGNSYDGVGVMTDNTVAVSWTGGKDGKGCGVVLYKVAADGSLDGKAGYWGVNSAETEKAKRTSGSDLEGRYEVTGKNPGGKDYKGDLNVKKQGDGYLFTWNTGSTFEGFGTKSGDKVAVGFGGKACSFVSYEVKPDGMLDGKWGGQSSTSFGTEVAKKK